jgi:hypothetical protein
VEAEVTPSQSKIHLQTGSIVSSNRLERAISFHHVQTSNPLRISTTFKIHASQTAEKQDDFEIEENHIFEDSILYTTSYDTKSVLLDSLYPTLYFKTKYTRYHILASAQTVETYLTESNS